HRGYVLWNQGAGSVPMDGGPEEPGAPSVGECRKQADRRLPGEDSDPRLDRAAPDGDVELRQGGRAHPTQKWDAVFPPQLGIAEPECRLRSEFARGGTADSA